MEIAGRTGSLSTQSLQMRIQAGNQEFLTLKTNPEFKNLAILLKRFSSAPMTLEIISGKGSLQECLHQNLWIINLLKKNSCFQVETSWFEETPSHYLSENIVDILTKICRFGWFESSEKSTDKLNLLLDEITAKEIRLNFRKANLQNIDLRGANLEGFDLQDSDLRRVNFQGAYLTGANLEGAYMWDNQPLEARTQSNNQGFIKLKTSQEFKMTIAFFTKYSAPEMAVKFFLGELSLEECVSRNELIIGLLLSLKKELGLQAEARFWLLEPDLFLHYLPKPTVKILADICQFGFLETQEESTKKLVYLLEKITE